MFTFGHARNVRHAQRSHVVGTNEVHQLGVISCVRAEVVHEISLFSDDPQVQLTSLPKDLFGAATTGLHYIVLKLGASVAKSQTASFGYFEVRKVLSPLQVKR